jgi:hypothetical protein
LILPRNDLSSAASIACSAWSRARSKEATCRTLPVTREHVSKGEAAHDNGENKKKQKPE